MALRGKSYPALLLPLFLVALFQITHRYSAKMTPLLLPQCTDAARVSTSDTVAINKLLSNMLKQSTFFSVFSVALDKPCPFWRDDDAQCRIQACSVDSCSDNEVPSVWKEGACAKREAPREKDILNDVDRSLNGLAALVGTAPCLATDSASWTMQDDDDDSMFVDLRNNPERYTGYDGPSAERVWKGIYGENCFTFSAKCSSGICSPDTCKEERVLYRLISGLHASISMHIAKQYLYGTDRWGINVNIYKERVRSHPERIANLHVVYAVVLRALAKAATHLHPTNYPYTTGNNNNDDVTKTNLNRLFQLPILNPTCEPKVFDESDMFLQNNQHLLPEFRNAFRNISMIMDCVGCEKCRLWGKLQFLGLGTAMRILFEQDMPHFQRNDVIALLNLLHKLSSSVLWIEEMDNAIHQSARIHLKAGALLAVICIVLSSLMLHRQTPPDKPALKSDKSEQSEESNLYKPNITQLGCSKVAGAKRKKRLPARAD